MERKEIEGALLLCNKQRDEGRRAEEERRVDEEGEGFEPSEDLMGDLVGFRQSLSRYASTYVVRKKLTRARGTTNVAIWDFCESLT